MGLSFFDEKRVREIVKEEIEAQTRILPTRDEFFAHMDRIYVEIKSMREEMTAANNRVTRNENNIERNSLRIDALETRFRSNLTKTNPAI